MIVQDDLDRGIGRVGRVELLEKADEFAMPHRQRAPARSAILDSGQPPAAVFDWIRIDQSRARPNKQSSQGRGTVVSQCKFAKHQVELMVADERNSLVARRGKMDLAGQSPQAFRQERYAHRTRSNQ